ncbi:MAG: ABC transporter permease, partial [Acidobacteriaceae bacterium]
MKIISIALKDLQVLFKDRGAIFQLFILPLLFIMVFSGALGAIGQSGEVTLPVLGVVDLDGGQAAAELTGALTADGSLTVQSYSAPDAQAQLEANQVVGVLAIPAGFTASLQSSTPVTLVFTTASDADPQQVEAIRLVLESIAADMTLESQIVASLRQMGEMQANAPDEYQVFDTGRVLAQARRQFESAQARPLISVAQSIPRQEADQVAPADLSQSAVPGFTVLFVFLAAQATASSIHEEKKIGSFRRLVAAPLSKAEILAGKILPNFI